MFRQHGHHDLRISTPWTSFYGGTLRTKCFRHQLQILQIWKARITVRHPGHHDHRISLPSMTSFYGGMLRTNCFRHQFQILQIWKARITDAFATITEGMLENTWRETDCRVDVLRATKGARVEVYWCVVEKKTSWVTFWGKKIFVFHVH